MAKESSSINIGPFPEAFTEWYPSGPKILMDEGYPTKYIRINEKLTWDVSRKVYYLIKDNLNKFKITEDHLPFLLFQIEMLYYDFQLISNRHEADKRGKYGKSFNELKQLSQLLSRIDKREQRINKISLHYSEPYSKYKDKLLTLNTRFSIDRFLEMINIDDKSKILLELVSQKENPEYHIYSNFTTSRNNLVREAFDGLYNFLVDHHKLEIKREYIIYILGWQCGLAGIVDDIKTYYDKHPDEKSEKNKKNSRYSTYEANLKSKIKNFLRIQPK
ncbi:hypothetical protein ACFLR8_01560 [Bacteroidota bacterium]